MLHAGGENIKSGGVYAYQESGGSHPRLGEEYANCVTNAGGKTTCLFYLTRRTGRIHLFH